LELLLIDMMGNVVARTFNSCDTSTRWAVHHANQPSAVGKSDIRTSNNQYRGAEAIL